MIAAFRTAACVDRHRFVLYVTINGATSEPDRPRLAIFSHEQPAMNFHELNIPDVRLFTPRLFNDPRGWFQETYSLRALSDAGLSETFVQDNHSLSLAAGTVRGLHFQIAPHAQGKLVRVVHGAIYDVAVDLRRHSPTYGRHVGLELSADNRHQVWIPAGFAHGFCTLAPNTEVAYKLTDYYAPAHERGIRWDDPTLDIAWPVASDRAVLSEKDLALPAFCDHPPAE